MSIRHALVLSKRPALAFMVLGMFWGGFAAMVPQIKAAIGAGDALFGSLLLLSSFGLLSAMWLAPLADRILGAAGLPVAVLALAAMFLVIGSAGSPAAFGFAMFLAGAASGLTDVIMNARVSEIEAREGKPLMNFNHAMFSFAYAASSLAAGVMREGGALALQVFAFYVALAVAAAWFTRSMPHPVDGSDEEAAKVPVGSSLVILGGLVVLLAFMAEASMESWSALHVERSLGGRAVEGALAPFMLGLTMGIGRMSGQVLASRLKDTSVIFWSGLMTAAGALIAAVAPTPLVAYLGFGILGLGVSVIAPLALGLVGRRATSAQRTRVISRVATIGFMGFFVAPSVMGFLAEWTSLRWAFGAMSLLVLAIPLVLVRKLAD